MNDSYRAFKKILVAVIFLAIVGGFGYSAFRIISPVKPPPTPDPRASLAPPTVVFANIINVQDNDYDFVAKVNNPNTEYGSGNVQFSLDFFDASGQKVFEKNDSFYILPGQTKYVIETPIKLSSPLASPPVFTIKSVDWQLLNPLASQAINLLAQNVSFSKSSEQGVFAKAGGSINNSSDLDLNQADVSVVILGRDGSVIAVNRTVISTFLAKTSRGFEVSWFSPFIGDPVRTDVEANTNVFDDSNFLRQYGGQERFQQFY